MLPRHLSIKIQGSTLHETSGANTHRRLLTGGRAKRRICRRGTTAFRTRHPKDYKNRQRGQQQPTTPLASFSKPLFVETTVRRNHQARCLSSRFCQLKYAHQGRRGSLSSPTLWIACLARCEVALTSSLVASMPDLKHHLNIATEPVTNYGLGRV